MRSFLFLTILISAFAFAGEEKEFSPSEKFLNAINSRQERFEAYRTRLFKEEVCPGADYSCVLKELKTIGIQSSGDLDNGISLLSFMAQKKFKKGECKEICRMNIYAEHSAAMVDFLGIFNRKKIYVNLLPSEHQETKYLVINEELRFFEQLPHQTDYKIWSVVLNNTELIGAAGLKNHRGKLAEYWGYIGEKQYWNKGLGRKLIRAVEEKARELDFVDLDLQVSTANVSAIALYKKSGYVIDTETSTECCLHMVKRGIR